MPNDHDELVRLSYSCEVVPGEGLREDYVFADYEGRGVRLSIEGPGSMVLPILRLANQQEGPGNGA